MMKDQNIGRPPNNEFENEFMNKIRGDKIQVCYSESELQICLLNKYGVKQMINPTKKTKSKEFTEKDKLEIKTSLAKIFTNIKLDGQYLKTLFRRFYQIQGNWKLEEIQYIFEDGYDLSYILFELHTAKDIDLMRLNAIYLVFLTLCKILSKFHNLIKYDFIQYCQHHINFMINMLQYQLGMMYQKYENQKDKDKKVKSPKTKIIMKEEKGKEKKNEIKVKDEVVSDNRQNRKEQTLEKKEQELAYKICVYTCWAYLYILHRP